MSEKLVILHSIPGRVRLSIPQLFEINDPAVLETMFGSMVGVRRVKLEPITQTILIQYDRQTIRERDVLRYIFLFCKCLEEVGGKSKYEKQTSDKKGLVSSWKGLEKNMKTFIKDKVVAKEFICILSFILRQYRSR